MLLAFLKSCGGDPVCVFSSVVVGYEARAASFDEFNDAAAGVGSSECFFIEHLLKLFLSDPLRRQVLQNLNHLITALIHTFQIPNPRLLHHHSFPENRRHRQIQVILRSNSYSHHFTEEEEQLLGYGIVRGCVHDPRVAVFPDVMDIVLAWDKQGEVLTLQLVADYTHDLIVRPARVLSPLSCEVYLEDPLAVP